MIPHMCTESMGPKIEITSEMTRAGAAELYANDEMFCSPEERVTAIFLAMFDLYERRGGIRKRPADQASDK